MKTLLLSSLVFVFLIGILCLPSASALPVSYNTTSINLGLTSVPRNSSSYDVFPLIPDNWLWEKFNNNTIDSGPLSVAGTITYNTNLKALWKFENVLTDSSTSGKTLTKAAGTTTYTTSAEEGSGLVLDGSTYYTASDATLPTGTNPVSVSGWVNFGSFASQPMYFGYGVGGAHTAFDLFLTNAGIVAFYDGTTVTSISTSALSLNTWYYLTVTYDGTNARVYINGSLDKTTAITVNTSLAGATGVTVGAITGGGANKMTGKLDELRIYSGTALTLAQHQALYMVGHYSQSHTFDGGEYVSGPDSGFPFGTNPKTISMWIKPTDTSSTPVFFFQGTALNSEPNYLFLDASQKLHVGTWGNNGIASTASIPLNTWTYIAITYDGSTYKTYINGSFDHSDTLTTNIILNQYIIGFDTIDPKFIGQIDNLKVYPYALTSSQINSDYNSISPISSGKQYMSWYNGISGSATLTQKLGSTKSSLTLGCSLSSTTDPNITPLGLNIYYGCTNGLNHISITSGTATHDFSVTACTATATYYPFMRQNLPMIWCISTATGAGSHTYASSIGGNQSFAVSAGAALSKLYTSQEIGANLNTSPLTYNVLKYNWNNTSTQVLNGNSCSINYTPTNTTKSVDSIVCDPSIQANATKYWNGFMITKTGNYATNSTQLFLSSIDNSAYKKLLTLPCALYGAEAPCITFILTDQTQTDYLVVLTSAHVYYGKAQTALGKLNNNNYGFQSYDIITQGTSSSYEIQNPILQSLKLYGPINLNSTVSKAGLFTLPSGYTVKTTSIESAIRTIDPRWTNDATDIPIITSTSSLFPIFLTVSNAPVFSAIKVTNPYQLINSQEAVWAVAQLDSTRTVEFDLPSNVCVNVYVADISVSPSIWNFQGIICASGVNQKTISYTNTLPFTFWTYPWGASDSFTPNTNGLVTTVRHTTAPFSYNIVLKNSTGTVFQNTTYTSNSTIDTQSFNLTGRAKPVSLYISSVTGGVNQIYSAFLGSPISLASTASFFNQYFSYQGFNLLAFIPIIFASMFTRNTIGIGVVLTVLCIATLSWLSVVVIPELDIMIMIVIAIIGLIAYRLTYY